MPTDAEIALAPPVTARVNSTPRRDSSPPVSRSGLARKVRAPWGEVILLGALTALGSVAMDMYLPALPIVTRALRTTPDHAQWTVSIFLLGAAFGQLIYGPISDRFGRRAPLLTGIAMYLAASASCALATTLGAMSAARLLQALGACAGSVVARAMVRDRYEDDEVLHVFSMLSLVFGVAPIVAPLIGGWVLAVAGWRWIFGIQALFAVISGGCALAFLPETRSEATRLRALSENALASYAALLSQPRLVGYLLTGSLSGAALFAYITAAPEVVITLFHVPAQHFGWVFGVNAFGVICGGQINARLARRIASLELLRWSLGAAMVCGVVMLICAVTGFGGVWGVLVPLFFVLSSLGFSQPNASAGAMTIDRERAGAVAALWGASFFGIGSLGGVATSLLHDGTARPMALVVLIALLLSLAVFETMVVRPTTDGRPEAEPTGESRRG